MERAMRNTRRSMYLRRARSKRYRSEIKQFSLAEELRQKTASHDMSGSIYHEIPTTTYNSGQGNVVLITTLLCATSEMMNEETTRTKRSCYILIACGIKKINFKDRIHKPGN